MSELNTTQKYEWFIQEIGTKKGNKNDYITFVFGCVEEPVVARERITIPEDIRSSILFNIMVKTGYKDKGGKPDPFKYFKRGLLFYARPVKKYRGGDLEDVRWSIDFDSISMRNIRHKLPDEKFNKIKLILSRSPSLEEAIRRMATTDPNLLYDFGVAVGEGSVTPDDEIGQGVSS
ncbi:MAG: hypothetical protein WC489_07970 [Patescibacteria group bacterium]|jgi:hypothetical protein